MTVRAVQPLVADTSGSAAGAHSSTADGTDGAYEDAAASELERVFRKTDFLAMHIHGQFNLGFIIASVGRDVFVVDQHAADEKHNFERLRASTTLNKRALAACHYIVAASALHQHVHCSEQSCTCARYCTVQG